MDFDNGIFHTTRDWEYPVGGVWICDSRTNEKIVHCRTRRDVRWCIDKLMRRRWAETDGHPWTQKALP